MFRQSRPRGKAAGVTTLFPGVVMHNQAKAVRGDKEKRVHPLLLHPQSVLITYRPRSQASQEDRGKQKSVDIISFSAQDLGFLYSLLPPQAPSRSNITNQTDFHQVSAGMSLLWFLLIWLCLDRSQRQRKDFGKSSNVSQDIKKVFFLKSFFSFPSLTSQMKIWDL